MPRSHNKERKVDRVSKNLSRLEHELHDIQRNNDRGRHIPNERPKRLIDRPKGQAGRSVLKGGYNLQEAMGLGDDNRKYNAFRMIARRYANRYLDPEKTIKDQDKLAVTLLLTYAQQKHAFLDKFHDNWPFNAFLATYLQNHVQYSKKRGADEEKWRHMDDNGTRDEMSPQPRKMGKCVQKWHHMDSDDNGTEDETSPRPRKTTKCVQVLIPASARRSRPAPKSVQQAVAVSKKAPPTANKPESISISTLHPGHVTELKTGPVAPSRPKPARPKPTRPKPTPKPKSKCGPTPTNVESPMNDDGDDIYEFADLPLVCPNDGCKDLVPANPSVALTSQLRQWSYFKKTNCSLTSEGLRLELEICAALRQVREAKLSIQRAKARGWPTIIVWESVSKRVLAMETALERMIYDKQERRYSFFHDMVLEDLSGAGLESDSLDREFSKLATTSTHHIPVVVSNNARPGYYGEKGLTIIQSAIFSLFDHEGTPNDAFAPLSFSLYTEYYLIPWVAIHLIAEDLDCSLETAYEEMIASAESGVMLHPMAEEDKRVEAIIQQHCVLSAEKRVAKIESFREEMRIEVEKAKAEKMRNTSAVKLVNKAIHSKDQQQVEGVHVSAVASQPTAGPSKFPGSYADDSEMSNLPDSNIQATSS